MKDDSCFLLSRPHIPLRIFVHIFPFHLDVAFFILTTLALLPTIGPTAPSRHFPLRLEAQKPPILNLLRNAPQPIPYTLHRKTPQ